jgi:hypothetical protein
MKNDLESIVPRKAWFALKEACQLKGLNYKTAMNKPRLKPVSDGHIGGKLAYSRETLLKWLALSDENM